MTTRELAVSSSDIAVENLLAQIEQLRDELADRERAVRYCATQPQRRREEIHRLRSALGEPTQAPLGFVA